MKRKNTLFTLLTIFMVSAAGQGVSPAIATPPFDESQNISPGRRLLADAHTPVASTCSPPPDGQDIGIVFNAQVLGKAVVLGDDKTLSADETLYSNNDQFKEAIDSLLAPYIGDEVHITDLKTIQDEVSLLYLQGDYITSWSDCVELRDNGNLVIHVTEGFIHDVNVGRIGKRSAGEHPTFAKTCSGGGE